MILNSAKKMHYRIVRNSNLICIGVSSTISLCQTALKYQVALARMCENILLIDTNSDITAVITTGASNRFAFVILILFDAFVNNWLSVNFNISSIIFNGRRKKNYVTFKLINLTVLRGLELQLH